MESETSFQMPVMPAYGGGYGNNGGFGFGGDGMWLLLFILLCGGGWGMGGFGMGGMMPWMMGMGGGFGIDYLYPWLNNSEHISNGFRDQQTNSAIMGLQNSVTSGFGDVALGIAGINQNLCQTGNGIVTAVNGAQNALSQQLYSNQLADLERSFAAQTASTQGMSAIQSQLAQCCCDNRAATQDVKFTLATEACATRTADANNTTAVLNALNQGVQSIKDQLCADKIEQKNDVIAQLRSELLYARGQASQDVQTAAIQAGQRALANEVEQYVAPRPIPSYYVQNPNCCGYNTGCGCGAV